MHIDLATVPIFHRILLTPNNTNISSPNIHIIWEFTVYTASCNNVYSFRITYKRMELRKNQTFWGTTFYSLKSTGQMSASKARLDSPEDQGKGKDGLMKALFLQDSTFLNIKP